MSQPFEFAAIGSRDVKLENWLSSPRYGDAVALRSAGGEDRQADAAMVTLEPCSLYQARAGIGRSFCIKATVAGHDIEIVCDLATVDSIISTTIGDFDHGSLGSRERALVIEHALEPTLSGLESRLGGQVVLHWAAPDVVSELPAFGAVVVHHDSHTRKGYAILHGAQDAAGLFANWVDGLEFRPQQGRGIKVDVLFCFGSTALSIAELRDLSPGDTVLIDDRFPVDRPLLAVAGRRYVAECRLVGSQIEAIGRFAPWRGERAIQWILEPLEGASIDMTDSPNLSTNQLSDMKVRLVFEVGRAELSVAEIEKLGPGHIFQVSRATDGHVDVIAGGRVIGSGELVKIGDDIGVRLKRVAS